MQNKDNNKRIKLNADAFYGRIDHEHIFEKLIAEIQPVDFFEVLGLPHEETLLQKHKIYAVVKHLIATAMNKNWNLCKRFDYIYIYNGSYWKQINKDDFKKFLSDAAVKTGLPDYEAKIFDFADKLLKQFISDAHLSEPNFSEGKVMINLQNGTFVFNEQGCSLEEFNPADFQTYQLPFNYESYATCPMFLKYLQMVLPDVESRMVLQEFAGFIFTNLNLEKILVLLGHGGNGKSVFFNILNALLGRNNVLNYPLGMFSSEYNRAKLTDVLLNYSSEKGFDLHPDTLKALVSGEPQQAREPYGKSFTIYNKVKFIINCNELPRETESTDAYFRRFLIVRFDEKISDDDKDIDLADKIIDKELPGVFNWLLEGLERIMFQKKFSPCPKSDNALEEFRKQADSVQLYIEENNFVNSDTNREALKTLHNDYKEFCKEDIYKPLGKNRFSKRLANKGFVQTRLGDGTTAFFIAKQVSSF